MKAGKIQSNELDLAGPVLCIVGNEVAHVWGMTTTERLQKQFARQNVHKVIELEDAASHNGPVILVRSGVVIDEPLVPVLARRPNLCLTTETENGEIPIAVTIAGHKATDAADMIRSQQAKGASDLKLITRAPSRLDTGFWKGLRKRETPYVLDALKADRADLEWRMFKGTYKGATDFVTKHIWPRPAYHVTRWLADTSVTPNMVTTIGAILTVLAFWLFWEGYFLTGLVAAWGMTFLDTVDGKLARTTLTSSKWGDVFDHGIDLIHPPFWYYAWAIGLGAAGYAWEPSFFWQIVGAIIAGYILQRVIEGIAIKWLKLEIHIWRPIDSFFRQITARRNPNLAILTIATILGRPDIGLIAVALWTVVCLFLHLIQIAQAFAEKRRAGELQSWMSKPLPGK